MKFTSKNRCTWFDNSSVKKNGQRNGKQRYFCKQCHTRFDGGVRLNSDELWRQYRQEKRTIAQLARAHACSERTIRRHLACVQKNAQFAEHQNVNVILDTTYFGRTWGVMVLLDSLSGQALSVQRSL